MVMMNGNILCNNFRHSCRSSRDKNKRSTHKWENIKNTLNENEKFYIEIVLHSITFLGKITYYITYFTILKNNNIVLIQYIYISKNALQIHSANIVCSIT